MTSGPFAERLAREDLTLCRLVTLTLPDGTVIRRTDFSENITYGGALYEAAPGIQVSAVRITASSASSSATIRAVYDDVLRERLVRFGGIDRARCVITLIDWLRPDILGTVLIDGRVRRAELNDKFSCDLDIELSGATNANLTIGEVYSQRCRNVFGDHRCKVDVVALQKPFVVTRAYAGNASFNINNSLGIPEDPEEEEIPYSSGTITYDQPGVYTFTIPVTSTVTAELLSNSGSSGSSVQNIQDPRVTSFGDGFPGNPGGAVNFGNWTLPGGKGGFGGLANYQPNDLSGGVNRATQANYARLVKPPEPELANLDYLRSGPYPFDTVEAGKGPAGGVGNIFAGVINSAGGDGGAGHRATVSFAPGQGAGPAIGADVVITIPPAALPGGFPGSPLDLWQQGSPGGVGKVVLTWGFSDITISDTTDETFNLGTVVWTKGENVGYEDQVTSNDNGRLFLLRSAVYPIKIGDEGYFQPGCTNYADVCENRWDNLINMQAEPAVPQGISTSPTPTGTIPPEANPPAPTPDTGGFFPVNQPLPLGS